MYRPISDYALIGDCHTTVLISTEGSIDWACMPHFDSPAQFLKLLDDERGGFCLVAPAEPALPSRHYLPGTNILETTWETTTGSLQVIDFMPVRAHCTPGVDLDCGKDVDTDHRIVRMITCRCEPVSVAVQVFPTPQYATEETRMQAEDGVIFVHDSDQFLHVQLIGRQLFFGHTRRATTVFRMHPGETVALVITCVPKGAPVERLTIDQIKYFLHESRELWAMWSSSLSYEGEHRDLVQRSALALKLMTYEPTGAIVAAPTTSLPEQIGGVRNWDYRYTWIRDATFTLVALTNLGYFGEGRDFLHFFKRTLGDHNDFQILYKVSGDRDATETEVTHLDGYRGSRPVRIGNNAFQQRQLDVFGELLHCIFMFVAHPNANVSRKEIRQDFWHMIKIAADVVCREWRKPDRGIWEMRVGARQFVYSKGMCVLALDRAIKLAQYCGETDDVTRWQHERDLLYRSFMRQGFNPEVGAFTQSYGSTTLDAAVLRLPLLGVIDANDPRMLSTIEVIESRLVRNGLVYRYDGNDGLPGREGAFLACSFWLAENYVLCGRIKEARELFRYLCRLANDVGLFSEEIDPETGSALGNFPQAFTHIAFIRAALRLAQTQRGRKKATYLMGETAELPLSSQKAA